MIADNLKLVFWVVLVICAIVALLSIIPAIVGWALLVVASIFITVTVTGYWATAGIGLAVIILAVIFSKI